MAVEGHGRPAGEAGDDPGADPGRGRLRGARLVRVVHSQQARPGSSRKDSRWPSPPDGARPRRRALVSAVGLSSSRCPSWD